MTFTGKIIELLYTAGGKQRVSLELVEKKDILHMKDDLLDIEIKKHRSKRSVDANAYCWLLCQRIAEVIGSTKELVYCKFIREKGQFEIVPIKNEQVEAFKNRWGRLGYGWFAEELEPSKLEGYTKIIQYYGSSVYDVHEMYVFLQEIITECEGLDIETKRPEEIKSMMEAWK